MRDPVLREGSFKQVEEKIKNGYTEIINDLTAHPEGPVCYMACHVALHDDKPGKFRVCQDAAGKVNGHCLNGYLLSGPDTLNSLFGIILRFRRHKIVLSADIKDFFYQVKPANRECERWANKILHTYCYIHTVTYLL